MTREEIDLEFRGSEWTCGYVTGLDGLGLTAAAVTVAEVIDRAMTAAEMIQFARGWTAGEAERSADGMTTGK